MNKLSLIPFSLLFLFSASNSIAMNLAPQSTNNRARTSKEILLIALMKKKSLMNKHDTTLGVPSVSVKTLAVPAIIVEMDNINPLKRTHENAFNNDATEQSKKLRLEEPYDTNHTKKHICSFDECDAAFDLKGDLNRHIRIHTNEKPFICTFNGCNKAFGRKSSLVYHKRIHNKERSFVCTECNKTFSQKSNLTNHKKTHAHKLSTQDSKY